MAVPEIPLSLAVGQSPAPSPAIHTLGTPRSHLRSPRARSFVNRPLRYPGANRVVHHSLLENGCGESSAPPAPFRDYSHRSRSIHFANRESTSPRQPRNLHAFLRITTSPAGIKHRDSVHHSRTISSLLGSLAPRRGQFTKRSLSSRGVWPHAVRPPWASHSTRDLYPKLKQPPLQTGHRLRTASPRGCTAGPPTGRLGQFQLLGSQSVVRVN
jgi:hypothetical protein